MKYSSTERWERNELFNTNYENGIQKIMTIKNKNIKKYNSKRCHVIQTSRLFLDLFLKN
jgi:hypothetical protein